MTQAQNDLNTTSPLTALEVCQVLTEVALGERFMTRGSIQSWSEVYHGLMPIEIEGWQLALFNGCDTLDYCEYCRSPDGWVGTLDRWQRDGADPIELMSAWEPEGTISKEALALKPNQSLSLYAGTEASPPL